MKKGLFLIIVLIAMIMAACTTQGSVFAYSEPVIANETAVFVGNAFNYAEARAVAIEKALAEGYTRILAEILEIKDTGTLLVTLIMIK